MFMNIKNLYIPEDFIIIFLIEVPPIPSLYGRPSRKKKVYHIFLHNLKHTLGHLLKHRAHHQNIQPPPRKHSTYTFTVFGDDIAFRMNTEYIFELCVFEEMHSEKLIFPALCSRVVNET